MEGLIEYADTWAIYLLCGLAAYWCWGRMAFWVKERGLIYHLYSAIGAVLIFTPVPIDIDAGHMAPGFVVVIFTTLSEGFAAVSYTGFWYGIAVALAVTIAILGWFVIGLPARDAARSDADEDSPT